MALRPQRPLLAVLLFLLASGCPRGEEADRPAAADGSAGAVPSRHEPAGEPPPAKLPEAAVGAPEPPAPAQTAAAPDPAPGGAPEREPIRIEAASGESWVELARRRRQEAARRLESWRPLYREGLRPVAELRLELAAALRSDSLEGLGDLCIRLGRAAEEVPAALVSGAPARGVRADVAALVAAYAAAGRDCAAGRPVRAWSQLAAGDRHWAAAARGVERLAGGPPIPESLLRRPPPGRRPE